MGWGKCWRRETLDDGLALDVCIVGMDLYETNLSDRIKIVP